MTPNWIVYLCLFVAALLTALVTTPLAKRIAIRLDAVDYPSQRRVNKTPIPRMGGIAMFCGLIAALVVQQLGCSFLGWPDAFGAGSSRMHVNYVMLGLAFVVIFLTGAVDDVRSLSPKAKLAGQILAALIAMGGGLVIGEISNPFGRGFIDLGWLAYPVTLIYLVAYVNIINLIDGLDGLAAGISCMAALTMFVLSTWAGRLDAAVIAIAVAGSTLGFLRYNFHPASIFMGDAGSLTLGFALGTISLLSVTRVAGLTTIIVPLVIAMVPIIDTFSAIVRRSRAHVPIDHADRGHIHHRLMDEGFDQRQTVLIMYAWTALMCVGAAVMVKVKMSPRIAIFCLLFVISVIFAYRLRLFEPVLLHHRDPKTGEDEIITPADAAFEEEAEKIQESASHPVWRDLDAVVHTEAPADADSTDATSGIDGGQ